MKAVTVGSMDCFGLTDIGRVRERNEDQFLIADLMKSVVIHNTSLSYDHETDLHGMAQAKLLLVADGVGGTVGGGRASSLAVEGLIQYMLNRMHWLFRSDAECDGKFLQDLKSALHGSQQQIQHAAEASPRYRQMGTTLTMAYLAWPTAYFVHVGDSRAYLFHDAKLTQLTRDQTVAQMLADAGGIAPDEVERHHFRHVLGSLLCCDPNQLHPSVHKTRLALGDQLLLCTDGITRHVSASQIEEILASTVSAEDACRELIAVANAAGGSDNSTVVVARFCPRVRYERENASCYVDDCPEVDHPTVCSTRFQWV
jgi:protein phosphatase